ncbi:MAG: 50S ribosomal protein L4 [Xanthomonadaceae bacterium]|jgi:large subunit ribosomal protein L4|nr:50S ribosomal protein L4 [Xanthomonadaceae bacterium]
MELSIVGSGKAVSVSDVVFGREFSEDLVHQAVVAYMAGGRAGTKKQKSRSDLSGTTKKFKKQKGGGARHGDYRAPIFVGGGVTFAARPRDHSQKINRKMYRGAISAILSELLRQQRLQVVDSFDVEAPKTKALAAKLKAIGEGRTLVVTENGSEGLFRAARNIPSVAVVDVAAIDPVSLIGADRVVMTVESVKKVEEWLA